MYSVLIVDDEPIIRRGIKNVIDWKSRDMVVAGDARNGREALEVFEKLNPDIVVTDINMPEIDGLELSEILLERNPKLKIIILTGYDDFEYAKKACSLGITEYILKPIEIDDLVNALEKAKKEIENENKIKSRLEEFERELQNNLPIIRENFLICLTTGMKPESIGKTNNDMLDIDTDGCFFQVVVVDIDSSNVSGEFRGKEKVLTFALKTLCRSFVDELQIGWTFYNSYGQVTILFYTDKEKAYFEKSICKISEELQQQAVSEFNLTFSIGIGRAYKGLDMIKQSFEEAREALEHRFLLGENSIMFIGDIQNTFCEKKWKELFDVQKRILSRISEGREKEALLLLREFSQLVKMNINLSPLWVKSKCNELAGNIYFLAIELGIDFDGKYNWLDSIHQEVYKSVSAENVFSIMEKLVCVVIGKVLQIRNKKATKLIEMSREFIEQNYEKDISISDIVENLYVTPNYFSHMFKKETGEGCVEYISRIRVEKAKKLLKETLHLNYQIAEMTGFKDANYFSLIFKKYVGVSPMEYRNGKKL